MTTQFMPQTEISIEEKHHCLKCKKAFDEPELIKYYACPHCHAKIEKEQKTGCQYWFGYLNQKEKNEPIPHECVVVRIAVYWCFLKCTARLTAPMSMAITTAAIRPLKSIV